MFIQREPPVVPPVPIVANAVELPPPIQFNADVPAILKVYKGEDVPIPTFPD